MDIYEVKRTSWDNFPPVLVLFPLNTLKNQSEILYQQAKAGNTQSAIELLLSLISIKEIELIKNKLASHTPILVPVLAIEQTGNNRLPAVFAEIIGQELSLAVSDDIVQAVKANHTNAGAYERIVRQPIFTGEVISGADYVIIDDTVAMGGTLAGLKGYIESQGGQVILAIVLTGYSIPELSIVPTDKILQSIRVKHPDLEKWWLYEFKFPIEYLTQGELGHLRTPKSLDDIRNRLTSAGFQSRYATSSQPVKKP